MAYLAIALGGIERESVCMLSIIEGFVVDLRNRSLKVKTHGVGDLDFLEDIGRPCSRFCSMLDVVKKSLFILSMVCRSSNIRGPSEASRWFVQQ